MDTSGDSRRHLSIFSWSFLFPCFSGSSSSGSICRGDRKTSVLVLISAAFFLHVVGVYWWFRNENLLCLLILLPPESIPPFWHAVFIIMVKDTLVRQAGMVLMCLRLIYYKNSRGQSYRKQGQLLTVVEHLMLLCRALLPTSVWYRFFLNKEYGNLFS